jgi:hypothetical protein
MKRTIAAEASIHAVSPLLRPCITVLLTVSYPSLAECVRGGRDAPVTEHATLCVFRDCFDGASER